MVETETASFWYASPEVQRGDLRTEDIETEVFLMPAAGHVEKEGTFTNTQRLLQWREKAVDPPGDARSENWFMYHLWRRVAEKAKLDPSPRNAGLLALTMNYTLEGDHREPSSPEILQEINGWTVADHKLVSGFGELKADGSSVCGCWIYSGVFPSEGRNRANERAPKDEYGHGWGWAWPADRRVIYNRASARPDGSPWSERKKLVWWDEAAKQWTGKDVPDFTATKPPNYVPAAGAEGDAALAGDKPYILHADGFGWLWVPVGLNDGPLPTHYEPLESPVSNPMYPQRQANPVGLNRARPGNEYATSPDARFPYVLTTYRLTEHHTAGGMSRTLSHLAELQPEIFCEISTELANELKIERGSWVTLVTARGAIEAHALSTSRIRPLKIGDRLVHQIGVPFHWGYNGLVKGDIANDLIAISEEPNVRIMETKGLLCNLLVGRRANNVARLKEYHSIAEGKTA
jgi:formate dehydrogenase major subunit